MSTVGSDSAAMLRTIELAQGVRGRTWPNPMVGCLVVRDGVILAEGQTQRCGEDHAEADALAKIDFRAEGATVYVNLEPCCHWGRTPPCTDAILRSGIKRVVVGALDPNPVVNGKGIEALRSAGLQVDVGLHEDAARALNEAHWVAANQKRPFVTLKAAVTLDGRTATRTRQSKWITGETAREHSRRERGLHQAVLVGVGTVLGDDPQLNLRPANEQRSPAGEPIRVILDSQLRTPATARLFETDGGPIWICTTHAALSGEQAGRLEARGARIIDCGDGDTVDLRTALTKLYAEQVVTLFVEGGATIHGAFVDAGLIDRWLVYVAPKVFGGENALPLALGVGVGDPSTAGKLAPFSITRLGEDLLLETRDAAGPAASWWTHRHGPGDGS
ncbi:MAG: bifunctional diaminohydroxyphosphoribosylaminopyrimidine deaminase/5-amino-6-(5-phosphoribosylamino)uracil reductase RibD [Myxococcota bacterium]|nr:bifunctional diaminohydroxyphosphoribosylaminopyrimidine deaminase/5-amino-6-(5-phosphoribosylamino)uracil reductase RibD [Myxococcota bacterium]